MGEVRIELNGSVVPIRGKGSRQLNRILNNEVLPVAMEVVTTDISNKAQEYARGADIPSQSIAPIQSKHKIGNSDSGYESTGELEKSIKVSYSSKIKSFIDAMVEYASWVEFGTGIFGKSGGPILPKSGKVMIFPFQGKTIAASMVLGQPPNPFMRGAIWYVSDNIKDTIVKIQSKFKGK